MERDRYAQESSVASISEKLLSSLGPWTHELNELHLPWGKAIAELCTALTMRLLRACTRTLALSTGEAGVAIIESVGSGRPVARMEMEQLIDIFEQLNPLLTEQWSKQPRNSGCGRNFFSARELHLLRALSRLSKGATADRLNPDEKNQRALQLLSSAGELCRSRIVKFARIAEERSGK